MLRLHRDSSRSYPGRSARRGVVRYETALLGNMQGDRAGVSRGHSRREETSPAKQDKSRERLTPPKGRTQRREEHP